MKPVIFNTEMTKAILEVRKTQTRRVIKPQPVLHKDGAYFYRGCFDLQHHKDVIIQDYSPYKPGDILYVKETWRMVDFTHIDGDWSASVEFKDGTRLARLHYLTDDEKLGWRPSTHMPKEAARIFLRVVDVRVERLQDITPQDAKAEGVSILNYTMRGGYGGDDSTHYKESFAELWDRKNAKRGHPWESNPWVWKIEFEKIEKP